jgi:hypothetical protein
MRKQIDFNHELIGTEGITVERRDGVKIDFVKVYDDFIRVVFSDGYAYVYTFGGTHVEHDATLLMFREVKEMSGEEFAKNEGFNAIAIPTVEYAFNAGKEHIKEIHGIK